MPHPPMRMVLVLTGPRKGWSGKLQSLTFRQGRCEVYGRAEDVAGLVHYYGSYYSAFPEGSLELAAAQRADAASKSGAPSEPVPAVESTAGTPEVPEDGKRDVQTDSGRSVAPDVRPPRKSTRAKAADAGKRSVASDTSGEGNANADRDESQRTPGPTVPVMHRDPVGEVKE